MGFNALGKSALPPFGFGCSTEFEDERPPVHNHHNGGLFVDKSDRKYYYIWCVWHFPATK
jgi:hypothetical protein